jgi:hypothetical protein
MATHNDFQKHVARKAKREEVTTVVSPKRVQLKLKSATNEHQLYYIESRVKEHPWGRWNKQTAYSSQRHFQPRLCRATVAASYFDHLPAPSRCALLLWRTFRNLLFLLKSPSWNKQPKMRRIKGELLKAMWKTQVHSARLIKRTTLWLPRATQLTTRLSTVFYFSPRPPKKQSG